MTMVLAAVLGALVALGVLLSLLMRGAGIAGAIGGKPGGDPAELDDRERRVEGVSPPIVSSAEAKLTGARVGDFGGPEGGGVSPGVAGYLGGVPRMRWTGGEAALERVNALGHADNGGTAVLRHPTTSALLTYASGQSEIGPMGWNWTHEYDLRLSRQDASYIDIQHEVLRWDRYELSGSAWVPEAGRCASLTENGDGSFTETTPYGIQYHFPDPGDSYPSTVRATSIVDSNANRLTLSYTGGNLTSILDAFGKRITLSYDGSDRVTSMLNPGGQRTTFSYDGDSNLESVLHPDGTRVTYSYSPSGHYLLSIQDPEGSITTLSYYQGKFKTLRDASDRLVRPFTYDGANYRAMVEDARGNTWTNTYDSDYNTPAQRDDPVGEARLATWRWDLVRTEFLDARGNRWTYTYDVYQGARRLTGVTSPLLCLHSFTYNTDQMPTVYTNPRNYRTTYNYDSSRNLTSQVHADGARITYTYDSQGLMTTTKDARSNVTTFSYDSGGNLESVETPDANVTTYSYDSGNRLTAETNPLGRTTTYVYDSLGRMTALVNALGERTTYVYDKVGRQTAIVDALGKRTTTQYWARWRRRSTPSTTAPPMPTPRMGPSE